VHPRAWSQVRLSRLPARTAKSHKRAPSRTLGSRGVAQAIHSSRSAAERSDDDDRPPAATGGRRSVAVAGLCILVVVVVPSPNSGGRLRAAEAECGLWEWRGATAVCAREEDEWEQEEGAHCDARSMGDGCGLWEWRGATAVCAREEDEWEQEEGARGASLYAGEAGTVDEEGNSVGAARLMPSRVHAPRDGGATKVRARGTWAVGWPLTVHAYTAPSAR
jgi:hypothetical protein